MSKSEPPAVIVNKSEPHTVIVNKSEPHAVIVNKSEPHAVIVNKSEPHTVIVNKSEPKIFVAQQILRGQRGATDISVAPPLELNQNDELKLGSFIFTQTTNLALWTINHNLDKPCPFVVIQDNFGETIIGDILCIDNNNLEIRFNRPTTGKAYLI